MRTLQSRTFVPSEAHNIAARFRAAASRLRGLAAELRSIGGVLDATWEGNSKNRFSDAYGVEPGKMDEFAGWLEDRARHIETITVTVWE